MRKFLKLTGITVASLVVGLFVFIGISNAFGTQTLAQAQEVTTKFKGKILAASDADMLGGAYADGVLNKIQGVNDSLSMIEIINGQGRITSQVHTSNSVVSWPSIVAWHPEKPYAYVAETKSIYKEKKSKVNDVWTDLPQGKKMTIVSFEDPGKPIVLQERNMGLDLQGASINYDGSLLVTGSTEKDREIVISSLKDGLVDQTYYFPGNLEQSENWNIRTMEFHPNQNIIAANLDNQKLVFYQVQQKNGEVDLRQLGSALEVAKHWSVGNWHPNGKHFILTDVAWGSGSLGFVLNGRGRLISVKFDQQGNHQVVSEVKVGRSPEGFDLSPDGQYAIVANMRRTYMPPKGFWFVSRKKSASLTLVKVNAQTGELSRLGDDYGFEGMLPEDAIFDSESNSIAVAVFHKREDLHPRQGWVDFWELQNDRLIKTKERVYLTRGVHNLLLVK